MLFNAHVYCVSDEAGTSHCVVIREISMIKHALRLYASSNGDTWYLGRDRTSGFPMIRHEPNAASGGQPSELSLSEFLAPGRMGGEHQALLRLIGGLIESHAASAGASATAAAARDARALRPEARQSDPSPDELTGPAMLISRRHDAD
jgi:hypothetical protein